jgi:hypothetical protein
MATQHTADSAPLRGLTQKERIGFEEKEFERLRQGVYSDILFVLMPFLAILVQRLWAGELEKLLLGPELSIATTVLGGLTIAKFVKGLLTPPEFGVYKERVVFAIAMTLFMILIPSAILTIKLSSGDAVPGVVAYVQPLMMVVAISLYVAAIKIIRATETESASEDDEGAEVADDDGFPIDVLMKPAGRERA